MKKIIMLAAIAALFITPASARVWKSSDGSKTFEGTLRSYDRGSGTVKVVVGGKMLTFNESVLSTEDREFLLTEKPAATGISAPEDFTAELEKTKIGALVANAKLKLVNKTRFKSAELAKAPEYYILYFSASW